MFSNLDFSSILYLDIETVASYPGYSKLPNEVQLLWSSKAQKLQRENETDEELYKKAGIYAEFGKVVCVSIGYVFKKEDTDSYCMKIKSISNRSEAELLTQFVSVLNSFDKAGKRTLCAHNGKEFDFPFLARRILINKLPLPDMLNIAGKKPWEINHLDTMVLWKFGDFKNYTSLRLLASVFNLPNPKQEISGEDVGDVFWKEDNLEKISLYCMQDVLTVAQLLFCYAGKELIKDQNVERISD